VRLLLVAPFRRRLERFPHHRHRCEVLVERLHTPDGHAGRSRRRLLDAGERVHERAAVLRLPEPEREQTLVQVGGARVGIEPPRRLLLGRDPRPRLLDERLHLGGFDAHARHARPDRPLHDADALVGEPLDVVGQPGEPVGVLRELPQPLVEQR
jgi:hypothetical protein